MGIFYSRPPAAVRLQTFRNDATHPRMPMRIGIRRFHACSSIAEWGQRAEAKSLQGLRFANDGEVIGIAQSGLFRSTLAEAFVRGHAGRGHGPIRIRYDLKALGVSAELISAALESEEFDWGDRAANVRRRKFGDLPPTVFAERAKQMRFLQYRGFSGDQIRAAFDSAIDEAEIDSSLDPDFE